MSYRDCRIARWRFGVVAALGVLMSGASGCSRESSVRTEGAVRVTLWSESGVKLAVVTDAEAAAAIADSLAMSEPRSGFRYDVARVYAKVSMFYENGLEKRLVLFSDGVFCVIGEGPNDAYTFDSVRFVRDVVRRFGCPLIVDVKFAGGSFSIYAESGSEAGDCGNRLAIGIMSADLRYREVQVEIGRDEALTVWRSESEERVWITRESDEEAVAAVTGDETWRRADEGGVPAWAHAGEGQLVRRVRVGE